MTREEAIRILDPETTAEALAGIEYYAGFNGDAALRKAVDDACILAVAALREQEQRRWIPVDAVETVDAVIVVRCRDCKHRGTDYCIFHIKGEPADEELLGKLDNDFCSYGERKDNV